MSTHSTSNLFASSATLDRVPVDVAERERRAELRADERGGAADAVAGAGDEHDARGEPLGVQAGHGGHAAHSTALTVMPPGRQGAITGGFHPLPSSMPGSASLLTW